tara:strand:+ start:124 stop:483 length:360 start_codon:yes stop_codon:yes gene_type:complete
MAEITITIGGDINSSLSVGDTAYYVSLASSGGFSSSTGNITSLGEVKSINTSTNQIEVEVGTTTISSGALNNKMLLFSKDAAVNTSGLTGYHATVKMKNNSTIESKLFSVGSEFTQSSK